ncbi:MAG: hypothetical protein HRU19_30140 [Pseudobacteriovorax sp.]|nr:hypothetical protein [Pseudobacteriovorax sp.]
MTIFKLPIFFLLLILLNQPLRANPEVFHLTDGFNTKSLGETARFFEDENQNLSLSEVWQQYNNGSFLPNSSGKTTLGFSKSNWWMAVPIVNETNKEQLIYFVNHYPHTDLIRFNLLTAKGELLDAVSGGDMTSSNDGSVNHRFATMKANIPIGESLLLVMIRTEGSVVMDIRAQNTEFFQEQKVNCSSQDLSLQSALPGRQFLPT